MVSIQVSEDTWLKLNNQKEVAESFDSVIRRLLGVKPTKEFIRDKGLREVKDNSEVDEPEYDEKLLEDKHKKRKK
jgi:predicted CopG family antitoxin